MLMVLGVLCLGTFLIAAFTWSSLSTATKDPKEVSLGAPTVDEWSNASFFEAGEDYNVTVPVSYNYHGQDSITYYVKVVANAGSGTIQPSDFEITLSGDISGSFTQGPAGTWISTSIVVTTGNPNDVFTIKIIPSLGAIDLSDVSFTITAESAA